jgi:hypothetical protein
MQRHHRGARASRYPPFRTGGQHFGADLPLHFARNAAPRFQHDENHDGAGGVAIHN